MTIEDKLKIYILSKYKSIRKFTESAKIPYTTIDGMLKRGILNSNIKNVILVCRTLGISADELINGKIVPFKASEHILIADIPDMIDYIRTHKEEYSDLNIDGLPLNDLETEIFLNGMDLSVRFIRESRLKKWMK